MRLKVLEMTCDDGGDTEAYGGLAPCELMTLEVNSSEQASGATLTITSGPQTVLDADVTDIVGQVLRPCRPANDFEGTEQPDVQVPFVLLEDLSLVTAGGAENEVITVRICYRA